jgi:broad specificity phosphatase PhoE
MGTIYLVRHAQAAYGTDDYDRLTKTGFMQARMLGTYFGLRQIRFDAVFTGNLRRHTETLQGIVEAYPNAADLRNPEHCAGLDEYSAEALVTALTGSRPLPDTAAEKRDSEVVRQRFRILKQALLAWTENRIHPEGMPQWQTFQDTAVASLVEARNGFASGNVLMISSGGPICAIVAATLDSPPRTAIELNLRMRNCSVTEFATSVRKHSLVCFNALPHLEAQADPALATYA